MPPAAVPGPEFEIDELEHQALDLLDELRCGAAWIAAQRDQDTVLDGPGDAPGPVVGAPTRPGMAGLEAAIVEAGEDPRRVAKAEPAVMGLLMRLVSEIAASLLDAAHTLSLSGSRGELSTEQIVEVAALLNESPDLSPAIAPAVETTGVILGLDRASIAWALLISLGERADADAPVALRDCSTAIAERLQAARPSGPKGATSTALRVFRSAAVVAAGPSVRARLLAAEHPELLPLASQLVEVHRDGAALVAAFDAARAALAEHIAKSAPTSETQPNNAQPNNQQGPMTDGPKRRFTWVHLTLALIVLGLTLWQYLWR